jgi:hypothetical protein
MAPNNRMSVPPDTSRQEDDGPRDFFHPNRLESEHRSERCVAVGGLKNVWSNCLRRESASRRLAARHGRRHSHTDTSAAFDHRPTRPLFAAPTLVSCCAGFSDAEIMSDLRALAPASEKRQGTKSWWVTVGGTACAMGI